MKELKQWLRMHPYKAMVFEAFFVGIAVAVAFRDDWFKWGCIIYAVLVLIWSVTAWLDMKKMTAVLLAILMIGVLPASPQEPEPPTAEGPLGVAAGIVVICTGGYCAYKLVKFCQKKFPKNAAGNTNGPPVDGWSILAGTGTGGRGYGASWNYGDMGSCGDSEQSLANSEDPTSTAEPITFVLDVFLNPGPSLLQTVRIRKGDQTHQVWREFQQEVAAVGLTITGQADNSRYFSRDGQPCESWEVPIEFDDSTGVITHLAGGRPRTIIIQRSEDMEHWAPLLKTAIGEGSGFQLVDTSTKPIVFFRVQLAD